VSFVSLTSEPPPAEFTENPSESIEVNVSIEVTFSASLLLENKRP